MNFSHFKRLCCSLKKSQSIYLSRRELDLYQLSSTTLFDLHVTTIFNLPRKMYFGLVYVQISLWVLVPNISNFLQVYRIVFLMGLVDFDDDRLLLSFSYKLGQLQLKCQVLPWRSLLQQALSLWWPMVEILTQVLGQLGQAIVILLRLDLQQ